MEQPKKPRVLAFVNQKGGVCKTTIAAQLAYGLANRDQKVLAIDMDPQGNLTTALGFGDGFDDSCSSMAALTNRDVEGTVAVKGDGTIRLSLMPSDISLAKAEMGFISRPDWQFLLRQALKVKIMEMGFDFILIDSPPNLGLLTINTLMAAEEIIIPLTCDNYAFNGLSALTETIAVIKGMNPSLTLSGVVAARVNAQRNIDKESLQKMAEMFPDILFKAKIPENTALKEAGGLGKSIWEHAPGSLAAGALANLCVEVMERGNRG